MLPVFTHVFVEPPTASARRGAKFLDENRPGWPHETNEATMDLGSHTKCPLGQLYGSFIRGYEVLGLNTIATVNLGFHVPLRFDGPVAKRERHADRLTTAWKEERRRRLAS